MFNTFCFTAVVSLNRRLGRGGSSLSLMSTCVVPPWEGMTTTSMFYLLTGNILLSQLGPLPRILPHQFILPLHHYKCSPSLHTLLPLSFRFFFMFLHFILFLQQVMWGLLQRNKQHVVWMLDPSSRHDFSSDPESSSSVGSSSSWCSALSPWSFFFHDIIQNELTSLWCRASASLWCLSLSKMWNVPHLGENTCFCLYVYCCNHFLTPHIKHPDFGSCLLWHVAPLHHVVLPEDNRPLSWINHP